MENNDIMKIINTKVLDTINQPSFDDSIQKDIFKYIEILHKSKKSETSEELIEKKVKNKLTKEIVETLYNKNPILLKSLIEELKDLEPVNFDEIEVEDE